MTRCRFSCEELRRFVGQHQVKFRFLLVGALNAVVGLMAYPALYFLAGPLKIYYLSILVISQVVCVSFSFLTQKYLVFRTSGDFLRESGKFLLFHFSYFLLNLAVLPALVEFAGMTPVWGQTVFTALVIVSSYFWHSRITFSSSTAKTTPTVCTMLSAANPEIENQ